MENVPVITILGYNLPPELEEKYNKWSDEVYCPYILKLSPVNRIDRYQIAKKDPSYPVYITFYCWNNLEQAVTTADLQILKDITKDVHTTFIRREVVWYKIYQLMRSFGNSDDITWKGYSQVEDAPFMNVEAYQFNSEEKARYLNWCMRYANRIYFPLLMKIPGVRGCDRYRDVNMPLFLQKPKETSYPTFLQTVHFVDHKAFENYEKSPEVASFKRSMQSDVSENLIHKWYVQYRLVKSFKK